MQDETKHTVINRDVIDGLRLIPEKFFQCVVTSPPYYGLRDYGTAMWNGGDPECDHNPQKPDGGERADRTLPLGRGGLYKGVCGKCGAVREDMQIGLEDTPEEYITKLVDVFREVRRVLRDDGTVWLNIGDSYCANGGCGNIKPKDLIGIPWMLAFALRADGWYLRQDIIWQKPNCMPESVKDRCTKSHEYVFLLSKSHKYYFDSLSIREENVDTYDGKRGTTQSRKKMQSAMRDFSSKEKMEQYSTQGRNKRSVWTISTKPFKGAHFAVFPEALVEPCIKAGSAVGDTVLDPFGGSGTVGVVAERLGRGSVMVELNAEYIDIIKARFGIVACDIIK